MAATPRAAIASKVLKPFMVKIIPMITTTEDIRSVEKCMASASRACDLYRLAILWRALDLVKSTMMEKTITPMAM